MIAASLKPARPVVGTGVPEGFRGLMIAASLKRSSCFFLSPGTAGFRGLMIAASLKRDENFAAQQPGRVSAVL